MIDELSALRTIEERFHKASTGVELGIGDDAAALQFGQGKLVLATTDCQFEDVHFLKSRITAELLARKAVAVSVSDIGAMGGVPRYILASVGFSQREDEEFLTEMISGFISSEREFGVELVGGNLSSSDKLFLDITVLGEVEPECLVKRSGACPGDLIYVSGTLGDSALGLKLLIDENTDDADKLVDRHLHPLPRLALARELAEKQIPTAMIDVSDGLLLDLERITVRQGLGARIELLNIPISSEYDVRINQYCSNKYETALSGGEDYELLFTSPSDRRADIEQISQNLNVKITEIGCVTHDNRVRVLDKKGEDTTTEQRGFVHFNN